MGEDAKAPEEPQQFVIRSRSGGVRNIGFANVRAPGQGLIDAMSDIDGVSVRNVDLSPPGPADQARVAISQFVGSQLGPDRLIPLYGLLIQIDKAEPDAKPQFIDSVKNWLHEVSVATSGNVLSTAIAGIINTFMKLDL